MDVKNSAFYFPRAYSHYTPLIVVVAFALLFASTFSGLYIRWIKWDEGLSHGFLVIGVFIGLMYKSLPWSSNPQTRLLYAFICLGITGLSLAWFLFQTLNISILEQLVLLPLLALVYSAAFGVKTAWQHRFLLLLPIFAIPVWDQLNNLLVNLSATVVGEMVRLIKMPAIIDGNSIYIPYGHILIADGCSGLRYFVIALAIGYIIGYLNRYDEKRMLAILAVAALIGLIANWIRIFILILVGYQTRMQSPLMSDHEYFGWFLFGLLCLPAIYFAPVKKMAAPVPVHSHKKPRLLLPLLCTTVGPLVALFFTPQPQVNPWQDILPKDVHPTSAKRMPITVITPERGYRENGYLMAGDLRTYVQLDQYQRQSKNDKLVPYLPKLFDTDKWSVSDTLAHTPAPINILREKGGLRLVAQTQWYVIGNKATASARTAKLMQLPALLEGNNRFLIVTLQSECETTNCDNAVTAIRQSAQRLIDKGI